MKICNHDLVVSRKFLTPGSFVCKKCSKEFRTIRKGSQ